MTTSEIRNTVSPMVIWMADATIRQARKAISGKTGWNKPERHDYNLPEVEMAGEVLFRMFGTCSAAIKSALIEMPEELDGVHDYYGVNYFDEFVKALEGEEKIFGKTTALREPDWILNEA